MLTASDIKKLREIFATKKDFQGLKKDFQGLQLEVFAVKVDVANTRKEMITREEFDEKFSRFMDKLDAVYKEVKDMREEQKAHQGQHWRITDEIVAIKRILKKAGLGGNP